MALSFRIVVWGCLATPLIGCQSKAEAFDSGGSSADADPDEDGLTNAEERELGTDPNVSDSDGDGINDGQEQVDGTNPLYAPSHAYTGGYNVGWCSTPPVATGPRGTGENQGKYVEDDVLSDWEYPDQHGETVNLYSFCDKHIVITVSAGWCGPCRNLAAGMQAVQDQYRDAGVQLIEIITQDDYGELPDQEFLETWATDYSFSDIPVIGLNANSAGGTTNPDDLSNVLNLDGFIPSIYQINTSMTVVGADVSTEDPAAFLE